MRPFVVCVGILSLILTMAVPKPISAQRTDTRFTDLGVAGVGSRGGTIQAQDPVVPAPQSPDSTRSGTAPSFVGMTISASLGSVAGSVLGIAYAASTDADPFDEGPEPYLAAAAFGALGSIPGSALGAWINGRNAGVGFGSALFGAFLGLGSGIALEAATGGASFPAAFVVGQSVTTALVAGAFAD